MRDSTRQQLDAIKAWPWFAHVGEPISEPLPTAHDWKQALKYCGEWAYGTISLQVVNHLHATFLQKDWHRHQGWNATCRVIRGEAVACAEGLARRFPLDKPATDQISYDLIGMCLEAEYADIHPPHFFIPMLSRWYASGHFPCGWRGPHLDTTYDGRPIVGELIVY